MKLIILAALAILTTSQGEVKVDIANIRSITYNKTTGTEMYLNTTSGTQTYPLSDIVRMTLSDVPVATELESISAEDAREAQKFVQNGQVYVVKNGKVYTIKGLPFSRH